MDERPDIDEPAAANGSHNGSMSPVLVGTEARALEVTQQPSVPAPVVAAAGGAVVGAAAYVLLRVLKRAPRRAVLRMRKRRRGGFEITGSRSFLVDVHMLKR
jgi:hypothetical protein